MNFKDLNNFYNLNNFTDFTDFALSEKFINIINKFDSLERLFEFMIIMISIPSIEQIDYLTKSNENLSIFECLQSQGYFKLLSPIQKYHLFVTACSFDSIDIAMLIFNNNVDLIGVKELMLNYLAPVGGNVEYVIFRNIWEKNVINFNFDEIEEIFFSILKSSNLEFIEWFFNLNIINYNDIKIKKKIGLDVLTHANNYDDFIIAKFICSQFLYKK